MEGPSEDRCPRLDLLLPHGGRGCWTPCSLLWEAVVSGGVGLTDLSQESFPLLLRSCLLLLGEGGRGGQRVGGWGSALLAAAVL